ncbi:MAG: response regulator transcription factor, partial [Hyphomicrobiaceae bacterium]|nr:response regulator transcription factor [Hyphomicrobiaceae bacterium]MDX2450114.1 response regulator transcription factor [Hyphomicrobiaceae bacterium]
TGEFDVIILDLMLPDIHGYEVCQRLRQDGIHTPILMLTAMDALEDKIKGIKIGADDYLTKPFDFDELLVRMEALVRRSHHFAPNSNVLKVADLELDRDLLEVTRDGDTIKLTAKELAIIELLMGAPGRVFSRTRILNQVWGYSEDPLTNVVDVYIARLRRKIDTDGRKPLIETVRGHGYRLKAPS